MPVKSEINIATNKGLSLILPTERSCFVRRRWQRLYPCRPLLQAGYAALTTSEVIKFKLIFMHRSSKARHRQTRTCSWPVALEYVPASQAVHEEAPAARGRRAHHAQRKGPQQPCRQTRPNSTWTNHLFTIVQPFCRYFQVPTEFKIWKWWIVNLNHWLKSIWQKNWNRITITQYPENPALIACLSGYLNRKTYTTTP